MEVEKMSIHLGLDFGTSTIYVTRWNKSKKIAEAVPHIAGNENFIENAIYYNSETEHILGDTAVNRGITNPLNYIQNVKRRIEDDNWIQYIESLDKNLNSQEISSDIFRYLKERVETIHGGESIDGVVISVPFAFQHKERQKIKDAAENAGLKVLKLIEEPVAAAISFGLFTDSLTQDKPEKVLIFDLGGGTFDVTIFELTKKSESKIRVEVLNTDGHKNLGGKDIDELIVGKFEEKLGFKLVDIENKKERAQIEGTLFKYAKELKETLSITDSEDVYIANLYKGQELDWEDISIDEFNEWLVNSGFMGKLRTVLENALDEIEMDPEEIDRIVLVGGSSKIPAIQDLIEKFFSKKAEAIKNPWELVGEGAGIYCGNILENTMDYEIITKISHAIGLKVRGNQFEPLINRNKRYEEFSTTRRFKFNNGSSGEYKKIEIYQGNSRNIENCSLVGAIKVSPLEFRDNTVEIALGTDANGIVKYKLLDIHGNVVREGEV